MENKTVDWERASLISELTQGRELVKELRNHLSPSSSTGELLIERTLSSLERALSMVGTSCSSNSSRLNNGDPQLVISGSTMGGMLESPHSVNGSPQSDDNERGDMSKRRKGLPTWSEQVKVCPGTGLEGPVDDGFSWRKYGQKDILGATYPRGYYRCTYRNVQGCLATKQVQRSDENPLIFDVTYRGRHTCIQAPNHHLLLPTSSQAHNEEDRKHNKNKSENQNPTHNSQVILLNFSSSSAGAGFEVHKPENLEITLQEPPTSSSSFSFPSTTAIGFRNTESDHNNQFVASSAFANPNYYMGSSNNLSPPFVSPATTSEMNSFSPCQMMNSNVNAGVWQNFEAFEPDFKEILSSAATTATTSVSNSPVVDANFDFDSLEFDPNLLFGSLGFLR